MNEMVQARVWLEEFIIHQTWLHLMTIYVHLSTVYNRSYIFPLDFSLNNKYVHQSQQKWSIMNNLSISSREVQLEIIYAKNQYH